MRRWYLRIIHEDTHTINKAIQKRYTYLDRVGGIANMPSFYLLPAQLVNLDAQ